MKRLRNHLIGVDQGNVVLFSDFQNDGEMWAGEGQRQMRTHVAFSEPFRAAPVVHLTMSMWDVSSETNNRADIAAEDVDQNGFAIVFRTWGDTKVARIRVGWMAIGEMRQADEWDLY